MKQVIFLLLVLVAVASFADDSSDVFRASGDMDEMRLMRYLMADYDKSVRPSRSSHDALEVVFGMALTQIIDMDERNQILTTNCWLNEIWNDHGLRWNASDFGNISVIRIPASKVWRPDIILYNNADSQYNSAILSTNVIVNSTGNVAWLSSAIFRSSCQINVEYFPFDEQRCTMKFASWTYGGYQVNLTKDTHEADLTNYVSNGEFDLVEMRIDRNVQYYSCCVEPYPDITYTIILRRRPLFYVFNLILPCVLITGVALLSFYMPSDSGEKVTLGITTLLSMTVFLMVIGESMPPTSEKLPLIGLYYGVTISLVSFATGLSVVTLNLHHRGMRGREVPKIIKTLVFGYLAKLLWIRLDPPDHVQSSPKQASKQVFQDGWPIVDGVTVTQAFSSSSYSKGGGDCPNRPHPPGYGPGSKLSSVHLYQPNIDLSAQEVIPEQYIQFFSPPQLIRTGSEYPPHHQRHHGAELQNPSTNQSARTSSISNDTLDTALTEGGSITGGGMSMGPLPVDPSRTPLVTENGGLGRSRSVYRMPPSIENFERQFIRVLNKVYNTIERNETRLAEQDRRDTIRLEWQQLALVIDRFVVDR
ncbi:unnamed protein product [Cyprideis torosa]|uniref:Uncharacterized protein n=1 Tax=Cyprideis torosa TaxID=163714 RepID=A0A7R8ZMW1_9CRUS|nr:unnamed protein product [Cyprideis torosa]CAG0886492.1 unnamed protein product [Cyprideis torosa]